MIDILADQGWLGPNDESALECSGGRSATASWRRIEERRPVGSRKGGAEPTSCPRSPIADKFLSDTRAIAGGSSTPTRYTVTGSGARRHGGRGGGARRPSRPRARPSVGCHPIAKTGRAGAARQVNVSLERRYNMMNDSQLYFPGERPAAPARSGDENPDPGRVEKARAKGLARRCWPDPMEEREGTVGRPGGDPAGPRHRLSHRGNRADGNAAGDGDGRRRRSQGRQGPDRGDADRSARRDPRDATQAGRQARLRAVTDPPAAVRRDEGRQRHRLEGPGQAGRCQGGARARVERRVLEDHGPATLAAAAFILAEFATAGLATAALVGFGSARGRPGDRRLGKGPEMQTAERATGAGTELLASGQADMATPRPLATVMVSVDAFMAAKPLSQAITGAVDRAALSAGGRWPAGSARLAALAARPDRALAERAISNWCRSRHLEPARVRQAAGDRRRGIACRCTPKALSTPGRLRSSPCRAQQARPPAAGDYHQQGDQRTGRCARPRQFGPSRRNERRLEDRPRARQRSATGKAIMVWRDST
jgi:hypothetical protein